MQAIATNTQDHPSSSIRLKAMLRPIFVALPMARDVDAEGLMAGYLIALEGIALEAVASVVGKLVRGTWSDDVRFCPRPPEIAVMCRKEAASIRERAMPKLVTIPARHDFKDLRVTARQRSQELHKEGYVLVAEGVTRDTFPSLAKSRSLPAGSIHLWAIDEVWAPESVAHLVDTSRVESRKNPLENPAAQMTEEEADYWRRISELRDVPEVTPEQMAYRREIAAQVASIEQEEQTHAA